MVGFVHHRKAAIRHYSHLSWCLGHSVVSGPSIKLPSSPNAMLMIIITQNAQSLAADSDMRLCAPLNTILPTANVPPPVRDAS